MGLRALDDDWGASGGHGLGLAVVDDSTPVVDRILVGCPKSLFDGACEGVMGHVRWQGCQVGLALTHPAALSFDVITTQREVIGLLQRARANVVFLQVVVVEVSGGGSRLSRLSQLSRLGTPAPRGGEW